MKKKQPTRRYARIFRDMMETVAWKSLGAIEQATYLHVTSCYNGTNNGKVAVSARQVARAINVGKSSAARALKVLIDKGFLVVTKPGAFNVKQTMATQYRLTEYAADETPATFDYTHWQRPGNGGGKIKTRSHPWDRTVPVAGPYGTCSGTEEDLDPD